MAALVTLAGRAWCDLPCASCHPKETAAYLATPMGRSSGPPTGAPSGKYFHAVSKTGFSIEVTNGRMVQRIERNGLRGEHEVAFAIGSGTHAFAYVVDIGGHLFESPLGYFPGRGWGMSPGYEEQKTPDFDRPVTTDCLDCHAGRARPVAGTFNTYQDPPLAAPGITCERCHGPVEAHLRSPVPGSIVNPAKLPQRARDSVCEQCHLNGEERVPNPGKQLGDFQAGLNLEDVYSVYVKAESIDPARPSAFKVVSQAQQLALSQCARQSQGKLWCGTCHDPHAQPADAKSYFRARCLSCHGTALLKTHPQPNGDCVGCHMPRRPVTDGAHTVFTDHRIARRPAAPSSATAGVATDAGVTLVAWHDPAGGLAERNLGLADVKVGDRLENFALVNRGFELLMQCWSDFPNDAALLNGLGTAVLASSHGAEAAATFEQAIQLEPGSAVDQVHAGLAWKAAHDNQKAIGYFEKALQLDPLLEQPYRELAAIYASENDAARLRQTYERYLKAFPQSIRAQAALRDLSK
ncbi:MAG TPA: multiheme c-type cytochrome [Terriglobia bacterium]|jgi:tetratricopeptide (TPR) repeat protein|nr:multiheme c-type cytochrome [Terriglobia bacterium]